MPIDDNPHCWAITQQDTSHWWARERAHRGVSSSPALCSVQHCVRPTSACIRLIQTEGRPGAVWSCCSLQTRHGARWELGQIHTSQYLGCLSQLWLGSFVLDLFCFGRLKEMKVLIRSAFTLALSKQTKSRKYEVLHLYSSWNSIFPLDACSPDDARMTVTQPAR